MYIIPSEEFMVCTPIQELEQPNKTFHVVNHLRWFRICDQDVIEYVSTCNKAKLIFKAKLVYTLTDPKPASIADVVIPKTVMEQFYGWSCQLPTREKRPEDIITFVDDTMESAPIILPKWVVLKYCHPRWETPNIHTIDIGVTQEIADAIMDMFENNIKPQTLTLSQFETFWKVYKLLVS